VVLGVTDVQIQSVVQCTEFGLSILAPGPPIQGQDRLRENAGIADYLEGENANQDLTFSAAQSISGNLYHSMPTPAGNDQLIWIMQSELLPLMERRVLGYVKQWLDEYYLHYGYYPYAAPFENANGDCQPGLVSGRLPMERGDCVELPLSEFVSTTVAKSRTLGEIWFSGSLWPDFIYSQVDPVCTSGGSTSQCDETTGGTLIVDNDTVKVLLVNSGEAIESVSVGRLQSREIENRSLLEYFEVPGLLAGDSAIAFRNLADTANDQYVVIR